MHTFIEFLKSLPTSVLISLSILGVVLGDIFGKEWSLTNNHWYLFAAVVGSLLSGLFYYPILFKQGLVTSSIIWTVLSIVAFILIGFLMYHEVLTPLQIAGCVLGVVAIILLSL